LASAFPLLRLGWAIKTILGRFSSVKIVSGVDKEAANYTASGQSLLCPPAKIFEKMLESLR
jgi:hypothetical protein